MITAYAVSQNRRVAHADKSGIGSVTGLSVTSANVLSAAIFHIEPFTKEMVIASYRPTHSVAQMRQHYAEREAWEKLVSAGYIIAVGRRWEVDIEKARKVLPLACQYRDIRNPK